MVLAALRPPFIARLDDSVYDMQLRAAEPQPPGKGVAIVDIDDRSLSTIGQWPWRRDVLAALVGKLRDSDAAAIALDIIFPEPDRFGEPGQREPDGSADAATAPDRVFADALRAGRTVLGYGLTFDGTPRSRHACVLHPVGVALVEPSEIIDNAPLFSATG